MGGSLSDAARGFSEIADTYVDISAYSAQLVELAALRAGDRVLDVGCGPGNATHQAAAAVGPTGQVIGVDLADGMLARARAALDRAIAIWKMDAKALAFRDDAFDAVVASSVLQFTGSGSLPEWRRVTRPGGRVAASLPWGPVLWYELVDRHLDRASADFQATFGARMRAGLQRAPDAARTAELVGFVDVTTHVEPIVQTFASPEEAWARQFTHGSRLFLDALPPDALEDMRSEYVERVATDSGAETRSEFHYWCFTV